MRKKQNGIIIVLFLIALFLIFLTYFYYPMINKVKVIDQKNSPSEEKGNVNLDIADSSFENVEYSGIYSLNNKFTVKSENAFISNDNPNIVHMKKMNVTINLNDGGLVEIFSDEGKFNKLTYDCFFEKNVEATDGETIITSFNLDLISDQSVVKIYNNVHLNNPAGSLIADKINYDFVKKYFTVLMYNKNDTINMKVIE